MIEYGIATDMGRVRTTNQDAVLAIHPVPGCDVSVFGVIDGSGYMAGDPLSYIEQTIRNELNKPDAAVRTRFRVIAGIHTVNEYVHFNSDDYGASAIFAIIEGNRVDLCHVGNCRAYQITAFGIKRLTQDHDFVSKFLEMRQLTREEARSHTAGKVLYRVLGQGSELEPQIISLYCDPDDSLLICSKGISRYGDILSVGQIDDLDWVTSIIRANPPQIACDNLIEAANERGGHDNISAIVVKFGADA